MMDEESGELRARLLFQSAEFREPTQSAGVTAPSEVAVAGQVHQVPAELVHASVWFELIESPTALQDSWRR